MTHVLAILGLIIGLVIWLAIQRLALGAEGGASPCGRATCDNDPCENESRCAKRSPPTVEP